MNVNEVVGEHTRPECGEDMKIEKCKMVYVAKVIFGGQDDKDHVVMVFDDMIMKVTDGVLMLQKRVV